MYDQYGVSKGTSGMKWVNGYGIYFKLNLRLIWSKLMKYQIKY